MKMSTHSNSCDRKPSKLHHWVQASPKQHLKAMHTSAIANKPTTKIPTLRGKPGKLPWGDPHLPDLAKSKLSLQRSNHRSETYSLLPSRLISVEPTWKGLNGTPQASLSLPSCAIPGHSLWLHTFPRSPSTVQVPLADSPATRVRQPKQAPWKGQLEVCLVLQALAADSSSLCSASPKPSPGRSSRSPPWALRGRCELPARRDFHAGHELDWASDELLQVLWTEKMQTQPKTRFHCKEHQ